MKGLPKEVACPEASKKSISSWDTLWQGLPAKKSVSHVKLSTQFAAGTRGFGRDGINLSKLTVSALLSGLKNQSLPVENNLHNHLFITAL